MRGNIVVLSLLGLSLSFGAAHAEVAQIVDSEGNAHYTGYLGHKALLSGEAVTYWVPNQVEVDGLPASYDARVDGLVSPIKDQGQCGSCWDFSMTKTLESARLAAGQSFLSLAEQDPLVNASGMYGCNGGFMDATYWVNHGLAKTEDCPYTASDSVSCAAKPADKGATWAMVGAAGRAPTTAELQAALVKYHVLSVTVAAGGNDWSSPPGGMQKECNNSGVNHMVNLVGYTTDAKGKVQFIGANSWGSSWGDKGFFYAAQGCNELASDVDSALFIDYTK